MINEALQEGALAPAPSRLDPPPPQAGLPGPTLHPRKLSGLWHPCPPPAPSWEGEERVTRTSACPHRGSWTRVAPGRLGASALRLQECPLGSEAGWTVECGGRGPHSRRALWKGEGEASRGALRGQKGPHPFEDPGPAHGALSLTSSCLSSFAGDTHVEVAGRGALCPCPALSPETQAHALCGPPSGPTC